MSLLETASFDRINDYASVKISLARPHDIRSWSFGRSQKAPRRSTTVPIARKRTVCFASGFSARRKTGNARVASIVA